MSFSLKSTLASTFPSSFFLPSSSFEGPTGQFRGTWGQFRGSYGDFPGTCGPPVSRELRRLSRDSPRRSRDLAACLEGHISIKCGTHHCAQTLPAPHLMEINYRFSIKCGAISIKCGAVAPLFHHSWLYFHRGRLLPVLSCTLLRDMCGTE